jgi:dTMP kinase
VEVGLDRARKRMTDNSLDGLEDRFEQHSLAFHEKVREGYLKLAAQYPDRFEILDATLGIEAVHEQIVILLEPHLTEKS